MIRYLNIFLFEFKHFRKSKTKVISYLVFILACVFSLFNGFELQKKHLNTIDNIQINEDESISEIITWYENGEKGPKDRSWIDVTNPYWSIRYTSTYMIKEPSKLLPLGIGQSEQYGYYQKLSIWSSPFDSDIAEEITNYERLINGNIDFSFLILFLLPLLLIILTFNINGLEKDLKFNNLITIQVGGSKKWIFYRLLFYTFLVTTTINCMIFSVAFINNVFNQELLHLILLSNLYIFIFIVPFYFIIKSSNGSTSIAFKMISLWLLLCVLIPGTAHQYANLKYPVNYMTDFLDANRKETYDVFKYSKEELNTRLLEIYPNLNSTLHARDTSVNRTVVRNTMSAIVNKLNTNAIGKIEQQNNFKNNLIVSTYWYNPVSYFQNKWNAITCSDYHAFSKFRNDIQSKIDNRLELLVFECWDNKTVDLKKYNSYLKTLRQGN
jgi:ABC-2 type transport system permease protein